MSFFEDATLQRGVFCLLISPFGEKEALCKVKEIFDEGSISLKVIQIRKIRNLIGIPDKTSSFIGLTEGKTYSAMKTEEGWEFDPDLSFVTILQ